MILSAMENQSDILRAIIKLHSPYGIDCDCTFGNGSFWKEIEKPSLKYDIEPLAHDVTKADSTMLPLENCSIKSIIFDPPFCTYIRKNRTGNGKMVMANRFGGYWKYEELEEHYIHTISECHRVLKSGGVFIVKCQDITHNHKHESTHILVVKYAELEGFEHIDTFILYKKNRMPFPEKNGVQKHARINHSYFLVFKRR